MPQPQTIKLLPRFFCQVQCEPIGGEKIATSGPSAFIRSTDRGHSQEQAGVIRRLLVNRGLFAHQSMKIHMVSRLAVASDRSLY